MIHINKKVRQIFKAPRKRFYLGRIVYGTPYLLPRNFCSTILKVKNGSTSIRCRSFKLFGREIYYGWPIRITWHDLGWKDKFNSPRHEWNPAFYIFFFRWQIAVIWEPPDGNDTYWEMILWYLNYSDADIDKAEKTWGWINSDTNQSTWNKDYLR